MSGYKCVITAGGIGTRLLPFSKEIPKEMCPLIVKTKDSICVKPLIQAIFEQLHDCGVRDFFIVVGRGKSAIQEHFTKDEGFVEYLKQKGKVNAGLESFYDGLSSSNITFVVQPEPRGFGDAVLRTKPHVRGNFIVHAGDVIIISKMNDHIRRLVDAFKRYRADASILLQDVNDPRQYGVVIGKEIETGVLEINRAIEKPVRLISKTAINPVYIFREGVYNALSGISLGKGGELQLTDAIQKMIEDGKRVIGVKIRSGEKRLDVGTPESWLDAFRIMAKAINPSSA